MTTVQGGLYTHREGGYYIEQIVNKRGHPQYREECQSKIYTEDNRNGSHCISNRDCGNNYRVKAGNSRAVEQKEQTIELQSREFKNTTQAAYLQHNGGMWGNIGKYRGTPGKH